MFSHFFSWLLAVAAALADVRWRSLPYQRKANAGASQNWFRPNLEPLELRLAPAFLLGSASNYAILFEGGSGTLQVTNVTTNVTGSGPSQGGGIGNIGIGNAGKVSLNGPGTLNGNLDVSASNTGQVTGNGVTITGTTNYGVSAVTSALNTVNALNTTLGALPGTNVTINGNTTINASSGTFSASGTGYTNVRVFNATSFNLGNGQTLTINGDANGDSVVLNFTSNENFKGNVVLNGGLTPDNVLFNFVGGPTLNVSSGNGGLAQGIFLDPNGTVSIGAGNVLGRVFGGDSHDFQFNGPSNLTAPGAGATPTLSTTASPTAVTLGPTAPPILTDMATLAGGTSPTGTITFTLVAPDGGTVDTEMMTVSGDGTYTTPNGYTLPTTGTATGTYQWDASYNGDARNNTFADFFDANEQVTVSSASPTITTAPNPTSVTLGLGRVTLTDTATLAGGFLPTGSITFRLFYNGGAIPVTSQTVAVNGNGAYTTPTGYAIPLLGTVTGTYQWDAAYNGDSDNNPASDTNALNELVTVSAARPTLTTIANPTMVTPSAGATPILMDIANLAQGFNPNGTITFTLFYSGGPTAVDTETATVNGNGAYTTPTGYQLPSTGAVTGTYQWIASFTDRFGNNLSVTDANDPNEQVTVSAASPAISTTANPSEVLLGGRLQDTATLTGGNHETGSITFNLYAPGVNPSGGTAAYTETVSPVNGDGTYGTTLGYVPNATGVWQWVATYDGDPNNNAVASGPFAEPVTIPPEADVALTKTVSNATPNVGDSITFTVTAKDNGPDTATNVQVTDLLPSGLQLTNSAHTQGSYTSATGLWTIGTLANGTSAVLTLTATVIASTPQTNTALVSHSDTIDPISFNNQASATETPMLADLSVSKTVDNASPNVGDTVNFLITVEDGGPNAATNVKVTDLLPTGLMYVSSTPSAGTTYTSSNGLWTVGTISNGGSATLQLQAKVVAGGTVVNTASITHSDVFDPNTANNSASATVTPQQADLELTKTVSNANPNVGDNITFVVTLTDLGPNFATGVTVQDSLPAGLMFVSATPSQGTYVSGTGLWTVGVVAPSTPLTLALIATVVSFMPQTNTASISGAAQFDPVTSNNTASITETPQQAELAVTKTVSNATPNVGDTISFTVTVKDNGPNAATDVQVNDLLPTGLVYVANTVTQGNYFNTTGIWTVGNVNNGAQATLTITAQVVSPTAQTNTATATADQFDPNSANNTANATETPQQADLAITKSVSDSSPNVGSTTTFTITVTNNGPNSATNVTVQELLGTGLAFVSATPSQGTYNSTSGVWTVGTVGLTVGPIGPTLLIVALATTSNVVTNTASIKHSDQFDPVSSNNSASIAVQGSQADLALTKTVDPSTADVGGMVTFTITVTNLNGSACKNVQVTDDLPAGLQYDSSSATSGSYNNVTGIWALAGNLNNNQSETLTIQATMLTTTAQTNTATITNSDRPDPNLGNNSGSATVNPATADLVISKTVNDPNPNIGANITYTIRVTNSGPDTATNVTVQDTLPAGVTFVSATPVGVYDPVSGVWTVGTVSVGTPQTLQIVCTVTRLLPGPNTASISHADQFDPVTANNSDSASISPLSADLALTKTVSNTHPNVGDTVAFTVNLTNDGPANATNVTVHDLLPTGLTLVGDSPTQGSYVPATGVWTVGTLVSSAVVTLTLDALVVSSAAETNTATITHSDQFDPNTANNSDTATETPPQADLEVFKFVDNSTPNVGDTVNFTIDIENIGPSAATNVLLNDLLPAGLAFVSDTPSQGSYNPSTGVWNVGTIPDGAISTLTLSAQVDIAGTEVNTAAIGHSDQPDPNTANNQASATVTTLQADLQITKTVSNARPNVGDTIAFTVTLTDLGPGIATNVQVADLLPAGLTLVSAVPSQGTYDPATGLWSIPTVTTALARTLILNAHVDSPDPQTNTATITASDQFDPDPGNDSASATETPQQADLGLTKTVSNPTPNVGDTIAYTVTLTNAGPDGATHVQVADLLPAGLGFVSATPSQGTYSSSTGLWNVGSVASNGGATLQIQAQVDSPDPQLNTATISQADQFDPDTANNSAAALETPQQADLEVLKSVSNPAPNVGDTLTYTISTTNNGPDAATNVVLSDVLPAAVSYQSSSASAGTYDPATRDWTIGTVADGATETLTIVAGVIDANPQANTATIAHSDQFDPNPANNSDTASINPQQADLELGKTVSNPTPNVGDTITFTLTLTDNGPSTATNVTVTDMLPVGLSFVSATPAASYDPSSGLWTVGTMTTAMPQTLAIQAKVVSPDAQTNTAMITAADQFDPDPANNQDSATETPQQADLVIAKSVSNATPNFDDIITFIVAVADKGPNDATHVVVDDLLPAGLLLETSTPSQGTYAGGVWTVGTVTPALAQTLIITAQVVSPNAQTNTASIGHSDQFDPDPTNNSASATETPQQADLVVSKTVSNPTPNVGDVITYTVSVSNAGPNPATGVQLTDLLPAGLTLVSATESQGTFNSATGLWTVGQVGTTAPATLTLMAQVASPAPTTNTATITHSDQFDPNTGNNTASATETPQQADLSLTKTVSNATPNVGDTITFTVTLSNASSDPATGVTVQDVLPAGLTFASASPSQGTYDSDTGVWTVGTVTTTTTQTLLIQAIVDVPDAQTNTATISHSDQFDPNTGNNSASATETPQQADLALTKSVSNATPNVGDTITFTLTLTNHGPDAANNVQVIDLLPAGLTFVSATPSASYNSTTGVWTVGTVTTAAPQTLQIQATVVSPAAQTNIASITQVDQFDPNTGNDTAAATETPQQADLQVTKTVSNPTPNVNDTITYTITLTDNGPDPATNVTVQDTLPTGVTFVSATPVGVYNPTSGVWTVGTVNPGTPQTLIITATVNSPNPGANTATISHADQFDPDLANNSDTASTNPQQADLSLSKTVSNATPNVGNNVTFTITLNNAGPSNATNVSVSDLLPFGLTFVSSAPSPGTSYNSTTGLWTVGTVANGGQAMLALTARVDSPNALTNTATISHADQADPVAGNNTASATETPQQADLSLSKSVNDPTPNVGDTVTFTVTLANQGPNTATNVTIQDLLPAGLAFVSATPSGSYNSTTGVWTVGTVSLTAPQTLTILARVVKLGPADQLGGDHPQRSIRSGHRRQQRQRHLDAAAGRPRRGEIRQQWGGGGGGAEAQRRRHDQLLR